MGIFVLRHINADMERQCFPSVHFFAFGEQLFQPVIQIGLLGLHREMIGADPAAVLISKILRQDSGKILQKPSEMARGATRLFTN